MFCSFLFLPRPLYPLKPVSGICLILCTSTLECCTLCLVAMTGISAFYTDLSGMTLTFFIIHAVCCLTVYTALCRCLFPFHIRVCIHIGASAFSLFKAVTACLSSFLCRISSYHDTVKITVIILIVRTSLYGTS